MKTYFDELEAVYDNRHQYSIEWAYKDAQDKLDEMKTQITEKTLVELKASQDRQARKTLNRGKWLSRIFQSTFTIITLLEFILSIFLVVGVSEISHQGELFVNTRMFSFSVILVFAFIKVFVEQYVLRPSIERLGWKMYKKAINELRVLSTQIIE